MEYRNYRNMWIIFSWILCFVSILRPVYIAAQTEGDTGYEYNEAYDDYDEESVLGIEPNFDVPIVNVTVVAGQTAVLPCSIEDLGRYKVAWLDQNNMPVTYEDRRMVDDFRFSVVRPNTREWNLQVRDIRWEDQGQYRCTINTQPPKSKSVVLHVKVPAQINDEASTPDVTFQEGDTAVLVCNVTGVPRPEVTWYRRPASGKINERESKMCKLRTVATGFGHVGETVVIKNVSRYCDDIYECVADNGVPPAVSRQMRVTVEFAPEIKLPNSRIGQELGRDTILECTITAFPHAMNYWEKDGQQISSATGATSGKYRVQPYEEGDHTLTLSLRIHSIQADDYGEYRCVAANTLGADHQSMYLYRYEVPDDELVVDAKATPKPWKPHYTSTTPERPHDPVYKYDPINSGMEYEEARKVPISKSDKLSSSSNSPVKGHCTFIALCIVCCLLTSVDSQRLITHLL